MIGSERATANEPRERSGARGPRERACRGDAGGDAPRLRMMFNGYADQVASMYAGMDLKKFY